MPWGNFQSEEPEKLATSLNIAFWNKNGKIKGILDSQEAGENF